jgi:leader peptidase (prepilin peptidase)/N-methyltransferase
MLIGIFLFILGLIIGSFINALEYRIEEGKTIGGRSFCPKCKHPLEILDLVPVVSWIALKGKCRYCDKPISFQYPLIELLTGFSFLLLGIKSGYVYQFNAFINNIQPINGKEVALMMISLILLFFIAFCLLLVALYDAKTTYVLSTYAYAGTVAAVLYHLINIGQLTFSALTPYVLSAIIPAAIFYLIYLISKGRWIGLGDAEIALMIGMLLGSPSIIVAYYFAFITGAIYGLLKIWRNKAKLKSEVPLGPFLIAGSFFAFLFGEQIFSIYVRIFLGG